MEFWWIVPAVIAGTVVYRLLISFFTGLHLWPRQKEKHFLHDLEGKAWPITLMAAVAVILVVALTRMIQSVIWFIDQMAEGCEEMAKRLGQVNKLP